MLEQDMLSTWYESLLVSRVLPVISVVTLLATGHCCLAGHVCNYFVKCCERFTELPRLLHDKKRFLVKRRGQCQGSQHGPVLQAASGNSQQSTPVLRCYQHMELSMGGIRGNDGRGSLSCAVLSDHKDLAVKSGSSWVS